jgi:hypothetical protein
VSPAPRTLVLRVTVTDAWRTVELRLASDAAAGEVKRQALAGVGMGAQRAGDFLLKVAGTPVADEARSLEALWVPDGAGLAVCPGRRRPVR